MISSIGRCGVGLAALGVGFGLQASDECESASFSGSGVYIERAADVIQLLLDIEEAEASSPVNRLLSAIPKFPLRFDLRLPPGARA